MSGPADDGYSDERPVAPGLYWAVTPDGGWEELLAIEPGPSGLVCVPGTRRFPPILLSRIPKGSLRWRRVG